MAQEMLIILAELLKNAKHMKTGQWYEISNAQLLTDKTKSFDEYRINDLHVGNRGCLILGGEEAVEWQHLGTLPWSLNKYTCEQKHSHFYVIYLLSLLDDFQIQPTS